MRILFLAHRIPFPPNKGEKIRALWELKELSGEHVVDLFCFCDDPEDKKYIEQLCQYCNRCHVEDVSYVWRRLRALFSLLTKQPFSISFFRCRKMARQIDSALRAESYDRIFVFSSSMAQYAEAASHIPRILDLVDVDSDKWLQYARRSAWPASWLWRREGKHLGAYEARLVRDSSVTLVCTEAEAELLRSSAPAGQICVLQNFLDAKQYEIGNNDIPDSIRGWQPYVIFSGSMDYRPNVDAALFFYREVFSLIRREVPKLRFVLAGRNPHRSLAALVSDSAVRVTGSVADMRPYIWGASAAVVPMRIARGVQNKILEALASGVPVVSSTIAAKGLPPALRSLVSEADTPEEISAALVRAVRNERSCCSVNQRRRDIRTAFQNYIESLALQSALRRIVLDPENKLREHNQAQTEDETGVDIAKAQLI
jgi:polysaccharide biosynthesis protein PslH